MALSRYVVIDDRSWLVALWYPVPKRMFGTWLRSGLSMAAWSDSALGATKIDFVTFRSQLESPRATGSSVGGHWHDEFMSAWVWFAGAILLSIAEVLGAEFVLLMLGGGALVTAGAALLFPELLWLQLIVFALSSVALVLGLRPMLLRKYYQPAKIRSGIEAVIGSKATVVSTVDADGGQVKIGGEVWSAVSLEGHRALPPGTSVTVVEVRGATAVVIWGP